MMPVPRRPFGDRKPPNEGGVHSDGDPVGAGGEGPLRRWLRACDRRLHLLDKFLEEEHAKRLAALQGLERRHGVQASLDAAVRSSVQQHARHDDQTVQRDARPQQAVGVGQLAETLQVRLDLALNRSDNRLVPSHFGELTPDPTARRSRL